MRFKSIFLLLFVVFFYLPFRGNAAGIVFNNEDDYTTPLAKGEIDVMNSNSVYQFEFTNKRKGNYSIGISFTKLPPGHYHFYKTSLEVAIYIYDGDKLLLKPNNTKPVSEYAGGYNKVGGFDLLSYEAPADLPLRRPLRCVVKILKGDCEFESKYGKAEFFIIKRSDK